MQSSVAVISDNDDEAGTVHGSRKNIREVCGRIWIMHGKRDVGNIYITSYNKVVSKHRIL